MLTMMIALTEAIGDCVRGLIFTSLSSLMSLISDEVVQTCVIHQGLIKYRKVIWNL